MLNLIEFIMFFKYIRTRKNYKIVLNENNMYHILIEIVK